MSRILLAILVPSSISFRLGDEFFTDNVSDRLSVVYPYVTRWAATSYTKVLTVVRDDYQADREDRPFDVPRGILDTVNVSIQVVTLKHLISLRHANLDRDYESFEPQTCVLLVYTDMEHLREIFNSPQLISFWQPANLYLLYDAGGRGTVDWFQLRRFFQWAFEKLWRYRRVYRVLLFVDGQTVRYDVIDFAGRHNVYFYNRNCDWYCVKQNEDSILMVSKPNDTDVSYIFQQRTNFLSYPMKISIFKTSTMPLQDGKYTGIDYEYLRVVTRMMNVTPVLMRSVERYGWTENGTFLGTIGHIVHQFADVSFNQFFMRDYFTRQLEFTTTITSDMLCAIVPKAPPIPDHLVIVRIFDRETWWLVFVVYFVILVIAMALKDERNRVIFDDLCDQEQVCFRGRSVAKTRNASCHLQKQNGNFYCKKRVYQPEEWRNERQFQSKSRVNRSIRGSGDVWSSLLSLSKYLVQIYIEATKPFESRRPWFPERLVLMCSMLMSVILNGIFTSQLASNFSKRLHYKDIDTLEELEGSGLPILVNSRDVMDDALTDVTSPLLERLRRRLQYANDSVSYEKLFVTRDAAVLHRFATVPLKYDEQQRSESIHVVKECPKHYTIGLVTTKGSPFRERINSILGRLNNGGFHGKWYRGMFQTSKHLFREKQTIEHRKITIGHLLIPFAILLAGLATSTVVFVRELRQSYPR